MPANRSFTSGLLTATGAETVHDTTATINYTIDGKMYVKTAITDGATPTTDGNTGTTFTAVAADKICVFVWALDSSQTVKVYQGDIESVDGDTDVAKIFPQWPSLPGTVAPFAYTLIQSTGAASDFAFGTSNWNATGITATTINLSEIPSRPQNS